MAGGFVTRLTYQNGIDVDTTVPVSFDRVIPSPAVRSLRFYARILSISGSWGVTIHHAHGSQTLDLATRTGLNAEGLYALTPTAPFDGSAAVPTTGLEIFFDAGGVGPLISVEVYAVGAEQ